MAKAKTRVSTQRKTAPKKSLKLPSRKTNIQLRDTLPFFDKRRGKDSGSWWSVKPTGDYAADLDTGRGYARAFLPLLQFNSGPPSLGWIVAQMALAGQAGKNRRGIDDIARGFLMEIGGNLQAAIVSLAIAAAAIETPASDLGEKFLDLYKGGRALEPLNRSTLAHDPDEHVLDRLMSPAKH